MARRGPHLSSKLRRSYSVVDKLVRLWTGIKILCLPIFSPQIPPGKVDLFPQQPARLVSTWKSAKRRLSTVFGRSPIVTQSQCWGSVNLSEIHS